MICLSYRDLLRSHIELMTSVMNLFQNHLCLLLKINVMKKFLPLALITTLVIGCQKEPATQENQIQVDIYYVQIDSGTWESNLAGDVKFLNLNIPGIVDSIVNGPYVVCSQVEANGWRDLPYFKKIDNDEQHLQLSFISTGEAQLYATSTGSVISIQNNVTALKVAVIKGGSWAGKRELTLSDILKSPQKYKIKYHY